MNDWYDAEQRVERAQQLTEAQRWADAVVEIEAALDIDPDNASWHAHHAFLLEQLECPDESLLAYERSLDLEPADPEIRFGYSAVLMSLGRYARVVEVMSELAREYPDDERVYCHRVAAYAELGLHEQAEEMFYLAQQIDADCPHCFHHMGESLATRGKNAHALACWQRVLEIDPSYAGVNAKIARSYRLQKQFGQARQAYLCELRNDAGNTDILFELAELALQADQPATAVAKLQQIIELEPDHGRAHFALGKIFLRRKQPGKALNCFGAASRLGVRGPGLELRRGEAAMQLRRFGDARDCFERACADRKSDPHVHVALGDALSALGRFQSALDVYRRALALNRQSAACHYRVAVCLLRLERFDTGLEHCRQAIRLRPRYVAAMRDAVDACLHLGLWRQAKELAKQALEVDPTSEPFRRLLRRLWLYRVRYTCRALWAAVRGG